MRHITLETDQNTAYWLPTHLLLSSLILHEHNQVRDQLCSALTTNDAEYGSVFIGVGLATNGRVEAANNKGKRAPSDKVDGSHVSVAFEVEEKYDECFASVINARNL